MTGTLGLQGARRLILASASHGRAKILKDAGLVFDTRPAAIDEAAVKEALAGDGAAPGPDDLAEILARTKAETVSAAYPDALVIGADQVLSESGEIFSKPEDTDAARRTLLRLSGKSHVLHTAVAVAEQGRTVWHAADTAELTMRPLSPQFIGRYLAAAGGRVCQSVGAYQIEALGIHLFARIKGDYFTILGLPLLPLLGLLRERNIVDA